MSSGSQMRSKVRAPESRRSQSATGICSSGRQSLIREQYRMVAASRALSTSESAGKRRNSTLFDIECSCPSV